MQESGRKKVLKCDSTALHLSRTFHWHCHCFRWNRSYYVLPDEWHESSRLLRTIVKGSFEYRLICSRGSLKKCFLKNASANPFLGAKCCEMKSRISYCCIFYDRRYYASSYDVHWRVPSWVRKYSQIWVEVLQRRYTKQESPSKAKI